MNQFLISSLHSYATYLTNEINNQSIIPSTNVIQLTLTLKMTTAQVVETSVTVNNNSPKQDYVQPDGQTQPAFEMTPGLKPFKVNVISLKSFLLSPNIAVQPLSTVSQGSSPTNQPEQLLQSSTFRTTLSYLTVLQPSVSKLSSHHQSTPSSFSSQVSSPMLSSNATLSFPSQLFQSSHNSTPPLSKSKATLSAWQPLITSQPSPPLSTSLLQPTSFVASPGNSQ